MLVRVRKAMEMKRLRNEAASLRGERKIIYRADDLVAVSEEMKAVLQFGETGTERQRPGREGKLSASGASSRPTGGHCYWMRWGS